MAVRNESVRLSLEDAGFTTGIARDAALVALFRKELDGLGKTSVSTTINIRPLGQEVERLGTSTRSAGPEIDKLSGRVRIFRDLIATAGPVLVPLGASILPAIAAGAAGLGAAAGGVVTAALAFNGLGDALKALNAYQLDKTPENLEKLRLAQDQLGPSGAHFLHYLDQLGPQLHELQLLSRDGLFPGLEAGIDDLLDRLPEVRNIIIQLSTAMGDLAADAGATLAGDRFTAFFDYLETDAAPTLEGFARSTGNVIEVFANLLVAFAPLTRDFTGGLESMTGALADWSAGLGDNASFQDFLNYLRESGPQAIDLLGSIAEAFAAIVEAAAPYGAVVLPALTQLVDLLTTIAGSDIGGPLVAGAAALALFNRGQQAFNKVTGTDAVSSLRGLASGLTQVTSAQDRARLSAAELTAIESKRNAAVSGGLKTLGRGAGILAGLGVAATGVADGLGLSNTASLALMGTIGGPWGAAVGGGVGLLLDWRARSQESAAATADFTSTLDAQTGALTENSRQKVVSSLSDSKALGAAKALGISLSLVTDAALGNEQALATVNAQLDRYTNVDITGENGAQLQAQATTAAALRDGLNEVLGVVGNSRAAWAQNAEAIGGSTRHVNELRAAYDRTTTAAEGLTSQLQTLDDFLSGRGTFRAYQASLDELRASLKDAPHAFSELGEAGRTNLGNLDQVLSDTARHLDTLTDPRKKATFLKDVISTLKQIGQTSPEAAAAVGEVIPQLRAVQRENKRVVIQADNADAMKKTKMAQLALRDLATARTRPRIEVDPGNSFSVLGGIRSELARIISKTITVTVKKVGSAVPTFDTGGYTGPGPRLEPRGIVHAGEVVIPQHLAQRDWSMLRSRYGHLPGFADGGVVSKNNGGKASTSSGFNVGGGAFFDVTGAAQGAAGALKVLQAQVERNKKAYDKEKQARDDVANAMSSLAGSVAGKFSVNLGDTPDVNPWTSSTAPSLSGRVQQATTQAMALPGIIAALQAAGLTGPALAQALQEMDFTQLQQLAANPSEAGQLGTALGGLYSAQQTAGNAGADTVYGAARAAADRAVVESRNELQEANRRLHALERAIKAADDNNTKGQREQGSNFAAGVNNAAATGKDNRVYQNAGRGSR